MKTTQLLVFIILSAIVVNASLFPVFAKAPTTPKIVFTSTREGNRDVYIMNPDGTEQANLTQHRADDQQAVWSPTGEQILFVSDRGGVRDLYSMDPDGSNVRRVFKFKIEDWRTKPTWSPDGTRFAYTRINWGKLTTALYIATLGEQEEELITKASSPAWSPDETELACIVGGRLTFINIRTGNQKQLLPKKATHWQRHPSWSAAGDKLAFSWNQKPLPPLLPDGRIPNEWLDTETIYIANRDGTGLQQLVDEAGPYAQYPELSPDGNAALYTQEINGDFQIFKVDVNSRVRTQLTHTDSWNTGGDWFDPAYALPVSPQPQLLTTTWAEVKKK